MINLSDVYGVSNIFSVESGPRSIRAALGKRRYNQAVSPLQKEFNSISRLPAVLLLLSDQVPEPSLSAP